MTRPERTEHVRLSQIAFDRLWETWGGVDADLMTTDTSAQRAPTGAVRYTKDYPSTHGFIRTVKPG